MEGMTFCAQVIKQDSLNNEHRRQFRSILQKQVALIRSVMPGQIRTMSGKNWLDTTSVMQKESCPTQRGRRVSVSHQRSDLRMPSAMGRDQRLSPTWFRVTVVLREGHDRRPR